MANLMQTFINATLPPATVVVFSPCFLSLLICHLCPEMCSYFFLNLCGHNSELFISKTVLIFTHKHASNIMILVYVAHTV